MGNGSSSAVSDNPPITLYERVFGKKIEPTKQEPVVEPVVEPGQSQIRGGESKRKKGQSKKNNKNKRKTKKQKSVSN